MPIKIPPIRKPCRCKALRKSVKIHEYCDQFVLNETDLFRIRDRFICELNKGLKKATRPYSTVKAIPTFIQDLPTGKEEGKFLAMDLGGSNFRILMFTFEKGKVVDSATDEHTIPENIMTGPGQQLFDYIACKLYDFTKKQKVAKNNLPLAFTFSFPVDQTGIRKGTLLKWTKGYSCSGVIGNDVIELLEESIRRVGNLQVNIVAVMNDTIATLLSCAINEENCLIGIIIGTGSNACHRELVCRMDTFTPECGKPYVLINNEWGAFGDNGCINFIQTDIDRTIDARSLNPGHQTFEKMISGMYLGEITRLALRALVRKKLLFCGKTSNYLETRDAFLTKYMADMAEDDPQGQENCIEILKKFGLYDYADDEDLKNVRYVCSIIAKRSAHLVASVTSALIDRLDIPSIITVAIDGSVYRCHPQYHHYLRNKIHELIEPCHDFHIVLSEDGSGKGAAVLAATLGSKIYH